MIAFPKPLELQPEEQRILLPGPRMPMDEWFEKKYYLSSKVSNIEGVYDFQYNPWLREIVRRISNPPVMVGIEGCMQFGKSTLENGILAYIVDQDPGPTMYVLPQQGNAERRISVIRDMFKNCPDSLAHVDRQNIRNIHIGKETNFDNMILDLAWSSSIMSMVDKPECNILCDELRFWDILEGGESPIEFLENRQRMYYNRSRFVYVTSPKDAGDVADKQFRQGSDERGWVPCHKCGQWHEICFSKETVFINKDDSGRFYSPKAYETGKAYCAYQCPHCHVPWSEVHRVRANAAGKWVAASQIMKPDGTIEGTRPEGNHFSYRINSMMLHPRFHQVCREVAVFVAAENALKAGDNSLMKNYRRNQQAKPWKEVIQTVNKKTILSKLIQMPRRAVPSWAKALIGVGDYHENQMGMKRLDFKILAFGMNMICQVIHAGEVLSWKEFEQVMFGKFPWADDTKKELPLFVWACGVDSSYMPDEVYSWCKKYPNWAWPIRGMDNPRQPLAVADLEKAQERAANPMRRQRAALWRGMSRLDVDKQYFTGKAMESVQSVNPGGGTTYFYSDIESDCGGQYFDELLGVHKVRNERGQVLWMPREKAESQLHYNALLRYGFAMAQLKKITDWIDVEDMEMPEAIVQRQKQLGQARRVGTVER